MSSNKSPRSASVAFKVEPELAELLDRLPNKSEFIRRAIAAQLGACCPLCKGKGIVSRGVHDHFAPVLASHRSHPCDACGGDLLIPEESSELFREDRRRLEQFFHGGPLYCQSCFETSPACEECGWHIETAHLSNHVQLVHAGGGRI